MMTAAMADHGVEADADGETATEAQHHGCCGERITMLELQSGEHICRRSDGHRPRIGACPTCGAPAGKRCYYTPITRGLPAYHAARTEASR